MYTKKKSGARSGIAVSVALSAALSSPVTGVAEARMARFASFKDRIERRMGFTCDDSLGSQMRMEIRRPRCSRGNRQGTSPLWAPPKLIAPSIVMAREEKPLDLSPGPKGPEKAMLPASLSLKGQRMKRQEWNSSGM
jgi:hypothetical protein